MTPAGEPTGGSYDPRYDPVIKGAAAAWHSLIDYAQAAAEAAADADPAALDVGDDYPAALAQLNEAVQSRVLHEVHDAAMRFQAAVPAVELATVVDGRKGEPELALLGAVMMLRGALNHLDEATGQLRRRFPDPDADTGPGHDPAR